MKPSLALSVCVLLLLANVLSAQTAPSAPGSNDELVVPVQAPATPPAAPKEKDKDAFREREVQVGSGKWALPGTLTLPQGKGPFPAVVLVHGSGPNDRDETIGPNKPFRDLGWGLASRGIAVLRYEKRTRHYGDEIAEVSGLTVKEETVDDALAGVALLRDTDGVDARRVFVLGHSFGGMLVPRIGKRDSEIAGYVLLAAAARPIEDAMIEQLSYIASLDGTVGEDEKKQLDGLKAETAKIKALTDDARESKERVLGAPASYWLDLRGYDAPAAARALSRPMLVLQGERDYMVTMVDFEAWKKALDGRQNVTFKSYPTLNHIFAEVESKDSPASYLKAAGVAEAVIDDIAAWVKSVPAPWLRPQ